MKFVLLLISMLTISLNTFAATSDRLNGYPIVFCDDSTQTCKNIARSDAQGVANKGGNPYSYYYGLNFSTAVIEKYQISVYQEPGLSAVTATNVELDSYAFGYADDLVTAFDNLNDVIAGLDLNEFMAFEDPGFSIEIHLFSQAYANPLECPSNPELESASDFSRDNFKRTQLFANSSMLTQAGYILQTVNEALFSIIDFGNPNSNNALRLLGIMFDFTSVEWNFENGDRARVTVDPYHEQFIVLPGSIVDCNGQVYPKEIAPNSNFEFSTTESLLDFARYYGVSNMIRDYNVQISSGHFWACTGSGGDMVCTLHMK